MLDLVAAERRSGRVALPVTTTRIAEQVAAYHGTQVEWTTTSPDDLTRVGARGRRPSSAATARGGFIVPEFSSVFDGTAAFVRLIGLVARTQLTLSQIDARIPRAHVLKRDLADPVGRQGPGDAARSSRRPGTASVDTTDGVRVVESDGRWVMVLPDPAEAVTHLWAEGPDDASAQALLDEWSAVVDSAGQLKPRARRACRTGVPEGACPAREWGRSEVAVATCDDVRHAAAAPRSEHAPPRRRAPGRVHVAAHQRHGPQPRRRLRRGGRP